MNKIQSCRSSHLILEDSLNVEGHAVRNDLHVWSDVVCHHMSSGRHLGGHGHVEGHQVLTLSVDDLGFIDSSSGQDLEENQQQQLKTSKVSKRPITNFFLIVR